MSRAGEPEAGPRLYGNWRPERGWGVGALSTPATVTVFVAVLAPLLAVSIAPAAALPLAVAAMVVVGGVVVRVGGVTALDILGRRLRFTRARQAGWTRLSAGVLTDHPRAADLPGVLAPIQVLDVDDGRGGRHALLWNRRTGTLSVVLRCSPIGLDLADPDQVDGWVAAWGGFLADLGYQPLVRHVAVTIDTHPAAATTLADHVCANLDRAAPPLARQVLDELARAVPDRSAATDVRLTLCLDPDRATPRPADLIGAAVEVGRRLPGLENGLAACGVALLGRAGAGWIAGRVRAAFDPHSLPDALGDNGDLSAWADAGPVAAEETWEHYRHDGAVSVAWALREAPRQAVAAGVLAPLLAPGPFTRRVTLLYQPYPAEQAAAKVEGQVTAGQVRQAWAARTRRDETQRDRDDRRRALQSAREEAEGAGVGRLTVYLSTTVTDDDLLEAAVADVEHRAGQALLRLRRLRGAHAAGFAAALGLGVDPADLLTHRRGR